MDPCKSESIGWHKYFVTFIDNFSRYCKVYFMKNKYEVFKRFKKFQVVTENETGNRIITLRSDIGGKYVSAKFES